MVNIGAYLSLYIRTFFSHGSARSIAVKKNIVGSLFFKSISVLLSLQVVPLTINYINPTRYGIWLTLSSIIVWFSFFDLGFVNGFRNRFAEAVAKGDMVLAREYVSTTYVVLSLLFSSIFLIAIAANHFVDWSAVLNVDAIYSSELKSVFGILIFFLCSNMVSSIFITMLTAYQKPALASLIQTSGQVLGFVCIYILTKAVPGNLVVLAFAFSGVPCCVLLITSIGMFLNSKYRNVSPSFRFVHFSLTKKIVGLGGQFFIIMISMLFVFQFVNIIISRVEGPVAVTQYNIAYKYFNILVLFVNIVLNPFWSAFTDAYVKQDYTWMKNTRNKLEIGGLLCVPIAILMVLLSSFLYTFWIGTELIIPISLSVALAVFTIAQIFGGIYVTFLNGIGKVRIQMLIYLFSAIVALPAMCISHQWFGLEGVVLFPSIVCILQAVFGRVQLKRIINNTAYGIWNK